jgi:hypothetical protein
LYNTELVQALRELKDKRDALSQQIRMEEETRIQLQHEVAAMGARLQRIDGSLHEKIQTRNVYDRTSKCLAFICGGWPLFSEQKIRRQECPLTPSLLLPQSEKQRLLTERSWRAVRHCCTS